MIDNLPSQLQFHAVDESWSVYYEPCQSRLELIQRPTYEIVLVGSMHDKKKSKEKLVAWVRDKSTSYLTAHLATLSQQTQLQYKQVSVRDQKTIWGSCTSKRSISLNYKLLFLPKKLVDYVIIHELCHTKHLDHSERFWNLVSRFDPNWRQHRCELRRAAEQYIPL